MLPKYTSSRSSIARDAGRVRGPVRLGRFRRKGAVFSVEMMMVITVLIPLMFALTEFSLLWSAKHLLEAAAFEGARAAAMPAMSPELRRDAAQEAVESVLAKPRFQDPDTGYAMTCEPGNFHGDMVEIRLQLPMTTASPDMLGIIGISIKGKFLTAEAVTARQN